MTIAHAFGLSRDLYLNSPAEAFTLVCRHYPYLSALCPLPYQKRPLAPTTIVRRPSTKLTATMRRI
jgi:hypothetical protein